MKSRRGISSVVGAVFAIIALSTVIGYITYSMNVLDNYNQSILIKTQQIADIANEKFQVSSVTLDGKKLNITVTNTGSLPVSFTKIWIINKTLSTCTTYSCNINYNPNKVVAPASTLIRLGQLMPGTLDTNQPYHVKLVTSRGNTNEFDVNYVGTAPLNIQLLALPATVSNGLKTELTMTVTNNSTGTVTNIVPSLSVPSGTATCVAGLVSPASYNTLVPGSTAIFKWDVTVTGTTEGQTCSYTASLVNGYLNNNAQATITLTQVTFVLPSTITPLNINLYAVPSNILGGNTAQLVMVVNNNSTGTVGTTTQPIAPALSSNSGSATCNPVLAGPTSYKNLAPGNTVIFKWDVSVSGANTQTCKYTASLAAPYGGYSTPMTTITISSVIFAQTTLAQNTGILTLNYTTFRWTQDGSTWNTGWTFSASSNTVIRVNMTNNNATGDFYIDGNTQIYFSRTSAANHGQWFIANKTTSSPFGLKAYTCGGPNNWCQKIPAGQTVPVYFGAKTKQTTTLTNLGSSDNYFTIMLLYGKFATTQSGSGTPYGQSVPVIALEGS